MPTLEEICQDVRRLLIQGNYNEATECFSQTLKTAENPVLLSETLQASGLKINAYEMYCKGGKKYFKDPPNIPEAFPYFGVAAIFGNVLAQIAMGIYYATNTTICNSAPVRFTELFSRSVNRKTPVVPKDDIIAVKWWTLAAEKGNLWAQHRVGLCYYDGRGVEKNPAEAMKWFSKASEKNEPWSQYRIGLCYQKGEGVEKDESKAVEWFNKAAEQGLAKAQFELGKCYEQGFGIPQDADKAKFWYIKAARQGIQEARDLLRPEDYQFREEERVDYKSYVQRAEQGDHEAQYMIGCCFYENHRYNKAVEWFRKALDNGQGYIKSRYMLGLCFLEGNGVEQNKEKGVKLLTMMADIGDEDAMLELGKYYRKEKGHYKEAIPLFSKLAEKGNAEAQFYLGLHCMEYEPQKALSLLNKSMDGGCKEALGQLMYYYSYNYCGKSLWDFCELGFEKDHEQAELLRIQDY